MDVYASRQTVSHHIPEPLRIGDERRSKCRMEGLASSDDKGP